MLTFYQTCHAGVRSEVTKNLRVVDLNRPNKVEILRSYLTQNDIIRNVNRTQLVITHMSLEERSDEESPLTLVISLPNWRFFAPSGRSE